MCMNPPMPSSICFTWRLLKSISTDIKPLLAQSGVIKHASFYPEPHSVGTQADMFLSCSTPTHPKFSSSLPIENTDTSVDSSYGLSQETVETEEEKLSQEKNQDAKGIAECITYLVYETSLLLLLRKCYVCGQISKLKISTQGTLFDYKVPALMGISLVGYLSLWSNA